MCKICFVCVRVRAARRLCTLRPMEPAHGRPRVCWTADDVPGRRTQLRKFHNPNPTSSSATSTFAARRRISNALGRARPASNRQRPLRCSVEPRNTSGAPVCTESSTRLSQPQRTETLVQSITRNAGLPEERQQESTASAGKKPAQKWRPSRRTPRGPRRSTPVSSSARRSSAL